MSMRDLAMTDGVIPSEFYSPGQWFSDPYVAIMPPFYVALTALFAVLVVGGLVLYSLAPRLFHGHALRVRLTRQLVIWLAVLGGLGLLWMGARALALPLFAKPLWLWLTLLTLAGVIGYAGYYWRRRYPQELSAWEERERRRRWMPTPRRRAAARRR